MKPTNALDLCVERPGCNATPRFSRQDFEEGKHFPKMNGKKVFRNAVTRMPEVVYEALLSNGLNISDVKLVLPHQANLRINEQVAALAKIPAEKCLHTIQFYGNTTAATVPLTIDHWRQAGKVKKGDRVLSTVFGSGFTWGAAIFTV